MISLNPTAHLQAFGELVSLLTKHRELTWEMTRRELSDRYAGQVFGLLWAVGHPIIMMCIYVFLFAIIFKVRMGGTPDMPLDYPAYLMAGLLPWLGFQDALSKSASVMVSNASLVKQVVFPIEILPVKGVLASLFGQLVCLGLLLLYIIGRYHIFHWTFLLLPALVFFQAIGTIGICYVFSAVGAYFRDLKDFVQVFCQVAIYLMPICYLPEQVPSVFKPVLYLNPFSYMAWCYQDILFFGHFKHWWAFPAFIAGAMLSFYAGYRIFRRLRTYFGNIL